MNASQLVAQLAAAGTPPELLAAVAKELFAGEHERAILAERREHERARKAKSRAVTGQDGTAGDIPARVSLDKEKPPRPPKEINPIPCVSVTRARGWHRLPEDWEPTRALPVAVQAKVDQWPPGALGDELADFRRWAANAEDKNGKGRKLDWDQAWRNWIGRRHHERYSRGNIVSLRGPRADPTLALVRAATAAQREDGGDHGQAWPALPAS